MDTDWTCNPAENFAAAGFRVVWSPATGVASRCSEVYIPTESAKTWDGATDATHAVGSRFGGYSYVKLERTGRGPSKGPGGVVGTRAQMTFYDVGACGVEVGSKVTVWIVEGA